VTEEVEAILDVLLLGEGSGGGAKDSCTSLMTL